MRRGWQGFKELETEYKRRPVEERTTENVTTQLIAQFFRGQAVTQKSKNPQGGMYGRVLADDGGKVTVLTRSGKQSNCSREYIELYEPDRRKRL